MLFKCQLGVGVQGAANLHHLGLDFSRAGLE
jgi:hypothetical protein